MPASIEATTLAEPLHFGDHGGLPLKLLWTACTWLTPFITANGAWLWWVVEAAAWDGLLLVVAALPLLVGGWLYRSQRDAA